jgi:hydroxysqualene dehydroxylase
MNKNVLIIGAGVAGLSAGIHLCNNGYKVKILERRNIPGGRAYSMKDERTGEIIDNGQHLLAGAYKYFPELLKNLGTKKYLEAQGSLKVNFIENGNSSVLNTGILPGKLGIGLGLLLLKSLNFESKKRIIRFFIRLKLGKVKPGNISTLELLMNEKQTDEAIAKFWNPIIVSALNLGAEKAAASLFITVMEKAFFSDSENSQLIFPTVDFNELFSPAEEWFAMRDSELMFNTSVKKLVLENGVVSKVITNNEEISGFDYVISALPPNNMQKILPDDIFNTDYFSVLDKFRFSPIISAFYWFDADIFSGKFAALLDSKLHWVFNRRKISDNNNSISKSFPYCLSFTISDAGELADISMEKLKELLYAEIIKAFPKAKEVALLQSKVIIEKNATPQLTQEIEPLRQPAATPIKNLFLAGDWTATGLPATLESAAQSGFMAADKILEMQSG